MTLPLVNELHAHQRAPGWYRVIPIAIEAGFILGLWIRWWAVPVVAVGWLILITLLDPSIALASGLLGAATALVCVLAAVGLRWVWGRFVASGAAHWPVVSRPPTTADLR